MADPSPDGRRVEIRPEHDAEVVVYLYNPDGAEGGGISWWWIGGGVAAAAVGTLAAILATSSETEARAIKAGEVQWPGSE